MSKNSLEAKSKNTKIRFVNVSSEYIKRKKHNIVLKLVNFEIKKGSITIISGPSGCGKTTLLKTMLGFQDYGGMIYLDEVDIESIPLKDRHFAYISQRRALYPRFTVFDNIAFPLKMERMKADDIRKRVYEIAKELDIELFLSRKPRHLSGGQQQKVAIARGIANYADVYLLDEPFSELDIESKKDMCLLLNKLKEKYGSTIILVTHDINDVSLIADSVILMNEEGSVEKIGEPNEINNYILKQHD